MRLKRILLWGATVLFLALLFLLATADLFFGFRPPLEASPQRLNSLPLQRGRGWQRLGKSVGFERDGILACSLAGSPAERGAALARFFPKQLEDTETSLVETVRHYIPSAALRWILARVVILRNHDLDRYISPEVQAELAGVAAVSPDLFPEYGGHFTRLMNYLAAHDISHALIDNPLMACTAFGASAGYTKAGSPLLARNFDFEAGRAFDEYKVVMRIKPDQGHAFLSVAWPGMVGVVSGMNDAGLAVVLLAGHSQGRRGLGTPVSVVAREILTQAATLEEAVRIATAAKVFVSESLLIGSGSEDRFIVVEKTPQTTAVRTMDKPFLLATNHFLSPQLGPDPANRAYMREGSSVRRFERMQELLEAGQGQLDPEVCAAMLRDRNGRGGQPLGLGNRAAINPLIASHSVVFDLKRKLAWVSAAPHQAGAFVPFSVDHFTQPAGVPEIPADPILLDGTYARLMEYQIQYQEAEKYFQQKYFLAAVFKLQQIRPLNPLDYHNYLLAGKALTALRRTTEAVASYQEALRLHPAFARESQELEKRIREVR